MFENMVTLANERVITAADWEPYIGQSNWLVIEHADMSDHWKIANPKLPNSNLIDLAYGIIEQIVTEFTVRTVHVASNMVDILVDIGDPLVEGGTLMRMDADELLIRMDAS